MSKTPPKPLSPKVKLATSLRPPASKAEQAAFKRTDKGVSKPSFRKKR